MNKQQLATRIWASANKMRNSKIEANEYKDFILGFIFYKYLSDQEEEYLYSSGWNKETIQEVDESDPEVVQYVQDEKGYFISYKNLFSTWLQRGSNFGVKDVTEALSAFNRLISPTHKKVFTNIFFTLQTILTKLGDTDAGRSSAIGKLFQLIKDIPTTGNQGYDVLGYIYEYLIGEFAANAGKKAGEFYTPHEVSQLMAEIVAYHLKDRKTIDIYDPTSGSGSLLITIGQAVAKYNDNPDAIKYYAQELVPSTYNLTRMNLVMRGIKPHNIITRETVIRSSKVATGHISRPRRTRTTPMKSDVWMPWSAILHTRRNGIARLTRNLTRDSRTLVSRRRRKPTMPSCFTNCTILNRTA